MGRRASSRARRDSRRSAANEATRRLLDGRRRARARCRALRNANRREKCREQFRRVVSATSRVAAPSRRRGKAACAVRVEKQVGARREEREVDVRRTWRRVCASLWPMSNLGRAFLTWQRKKSCFYLYSVRMGNQSDGFPTRGVENRERPNRRSSSAERFGERRFAARRVRLAFERSAAPVKFAGAGEERQVAWRSIACSTS